MVILATLASSLLLLLMVQLPPASAEEDRCTYPLENIPYLTFNGRRLPNNSFIPVSEISEYKPLLCHTNTNTCCNVLDSKGGYIGNWSLPNGDIVGAVDGSGYGIFRSTELIELVYQNGTDSIGIVPPRVTGIYSCTVPISTGRKTRLETVFVGLYAVNTLEIEDMYITENSDLNGDTPQFTISCTSTGGPVGCVVWRLHKMLIPNPNVTSAVIDRVNGVYVHNLTISEVIGGPYSCSVNNDRPANDYEGIYVEYARDPLYCLAEQISPSSIIVRWQKDTSQDKAIGFRIYYRGTTNGSLDVDDSEADSCVLTGLKNNGTYHVYVAAKSIHLPSDRIPAAYPVNMAPGPPELQLNSVTSDSLTFSWTYPEGSLVDGIEVQWDINHSQATTIRDKLPASRTNYTITGLENFGNSTYTITVIAHNSVGSSVSSRMNILANVAGQGQSDESSGAVSGNDSNDVMIIGIVIAVLVLGAIVLITLGLLVYHYKSKNRRSLYSLQGPSSSLSPSLSQQPLHVHPFPRPPPRPTDITTTSNSSYAPRVNAIAGDGDQDNGYYTAMSYIYPNTPMIPPSHSPQATPTQSPQQGSGGENDETSSPAGQDHQATNKDGHKYDYISILK